MFDERDYVVVFSRCRDWLGRTLTKRLKVSFITEEEPVVEEPEPVVEEPEPVVEEPVEEEPIEEVEISEEEAAEIYKEAIVTKINNGDDV